MQDIEKIYPNSTLPPRLLYTEELIFQTRLLDLIIKLCRIGSLWSILIRSQLLNISQLYDVNIAQIMYKAMNYQVLY